MVTGSSAPFLVICCSEGVSDPTSRNHGPPETWHKNCAVPRELLLSVALNSGGETQSWVTQISSVISCAVIKPEKKNYWRGKSITSGWEGHPAEITEARNAGNPQGKRRSINRALQQSLLIRVRSMAPSLFTVPSFISPTFFLRAKQMLFSCHVQSSQSLLTSSLKVSLFVHNIQDQSNVAESFPMW